MNRTVVLEKELTDAVDTGVARSGREPDQVTEHAVRHYLDPSVIDRHRGRTQLDKDKAMMRCDVCDNGERVSTKRSRIAERNNLTAVVGGVPVEECPACGHIWLTMSVAKRLDVLFDQLLASGAELAHAHWGGPRAA